ncbi:MAG: hypothetical protein J6B06_00760 [Lachnospiraceae bacterium]|nr:hypothetical protein [Lachnospiraceae bacterium]
MPELAEIFHVSIDSLFYEREDTKKPGFDLPKDERAACVSRKTHAALLYVEVLPLNHKPFQSQTRS